MSNSSRHLIKPGTLLMLVIILMSLKYLYDQKKDTPTNALDKTDFTQLERTMSQRLLAIPDRVKRRANHYQGRFEYTPYQASFDVLMHVQELFTGEAIVNVSKDCEQWTEDFALQLKSRSNTNQAVFDYQSQRMEDLTHLNVSIISETQTWFNGENEKQREVLKFRKEAKRVVVDNTEETATLDPETKFNIELTQFTLNQIEQTNFEFEYLSEPSDFSQYPLKHQIEILPFKEFHELDNTWLVRSREFKFDGEVYVLNATTIELINDKATTIYAASIDSEGVLYELILKNFEYKPSRCQKRATI